MFDVQVWNIHEQDLELKSCGIALWTSHTMHALSPACTSTDTYALRHLHYAHHTGTHAPYILVPLAWHTRGIHICESDAFICTGGRHSPNGETVIASTYLFRSSVSWGSQLPERRQNIHDAFATRSFSRYPIPNPQP